MQGEPVSTIAAVCNPENDEIRKMYDMHHSGMDKTLFLARKVDPHTTRDAVKCVVERCQSIDPAPSR